MSNGILHTKIEFLKGIGPQRAALLNTELGIFTYEDLLFNFPFRYEDRSKFTPIRELSEEMPSAQIRGTIKGLRNVNNKRLVVQLGDGSGIVELVWFRGIKWIEKKLKSGVEYVVYGKPTLFGSQINMAHPEIEIFTESSLSRGLEPVYNLTEKLKNKFIDSKAISKMMKQLLEVVEEKVQETLPSYIIQSQQLLPISNALKHIHFPSNEFTLQQSLKRFKFEELLYLQLRMIKSGKYNVQADRGLVFKHIPRLNEFYKNHLPFDLTNAQKKVIREIYQDVCSGKQMNRLLQGDVGSGKTIVAFICMLMAVDNQAQACLMAPTEILATQHYEGLKPYAEKLGIHIELLTGSTKKSNREKILSQLYEGTCHIIVGTHALLENPVQFQNLGLVIIDEQHRFGVAQRAKLWSKNKNIRPHVLVMTATPIPRTLAMTLYGDLDVSEIDELPAGRKPIKTLHRFDRHRLEVFGFMRKQLQEGRQVYVVYPLIEESEKMDLKFVTDGYHAIEKAFPEVAASMMHGKMSSEAKEFDMQRFKKGETKIMVATTVIEVGVNVPNATVMVIENAERFGISQLHQLRGRVGRGAEQSYCILMTGDKLSQDSKVRIETMCRTNNGFEIADVDLRLRGPGDIMGTQQSGVLDLRVADIAKDSALIKHTREIAIKILDKDPELKLSENNLLREQLNRILQKHNLIWSNIS